MYTPHSGFAPRKRSKNAREGAGWKVGTMWPARRIVAKLKSCAPEGQAEARQWAGVKPRARALRMARECTPHAGCGAGVVCALGAPCLARRRRCTW